MNVHGARSKQAKEMGSPPLSSCHPTHLEKESERVLHAIEIVLVQDSKLKLDSLSSLGCMEASFHFDIVRTHHHHIQSPYIPLPSPSNVRDHLSSDDPGGHPEKSLGLSFQRTERLSLSLSLYGGGELSLGVGAKQQTAAVATFRDRYQDRGVPSPPPHQHPPVVVSASETLYLFSLIPDHILIF